MKLKTKVFLHSIVILVLFLAVISSCKKDTSSPNNAATKKTLKYEVQCTPSAGIQYTQANGQTISRDADNWSIEFEVTNGFSYYISASENTGLYTNMHVYVYLDNNVIKSASNSGYSCSATAEGTASW